jgi:Magnesium chelatase, subunit ChlI
MAQNRAGESFRECPYEASQIGKDSCSARVFDLVTQVLASYAQSGGPFVGIHASNHGRVMISPRDIPLKCHGQVGEALRVSGGMGEQDQAGAEAGVKQRRGLRLAMTWSRRNGRGGWNWGDKRGVRPAVSRGSSAVALAATRLSYATSEGPCTGRYVGLGPTMVGGTSYPASRAHRGILCSDERPECTRHVLEVLRQPLEEGIT